MISKYRAGRVYTHISFFFVYGSIVFSLFHYLPVIKFLEEF